MKDSLRRVLALGLSVMMLLSNLPASAIAQGNAGQDDQGVPVIPADVFGDSENASIGAQETLWEISEAFQFGADELATGEETQTPELTQKDWNYTARVLVSVNGDAVSDYDAYAPEYGDGIQAGDVIRFLYTITNENTGAPETESITLNVFSDLSMVTGNTERPLRSPFTQTGKTKTGNSAWDPAETDGEKDLLLSGYWTSEPTSDGKGKITIPPNTTVAFRMSAAYPVSEGSDVEDLVNRLRAWPSDPDSLETFENLYESEAEARGKNAEISVSLTQDGEEEPDPEPDENPKLTFTKKASVQNATPEGRFGYTLTVSNVGEEPVLGARVVDALPDEVAFAGFARVMDEEHAEYDGGKHEIVWTIDELAANGEQTLMFTVQVGSDGTQPVGHLTDANGNFIASFTNVATLTGDRLPEADADGAYVARETTSIADVNIEMEADDAGIAQERGYYVKEDRITYTVTVTNVGDVTLTDVVVENAMFSKARDLTAEIGGGKTRSDATDMEAKLDGDKLTINVFPAGYVATITFVYPVAVEDLETDDPIVSTSKVTAKYPTGGSDNAVGDIPEREVTVQLQAGPKRDLEISKSVENLTRDTGDPVRMGDELGYTIVVRNTGNASLNNLFVSDAMFARAKDRKATIIRGDKLETIQLAGTSLSLPGLAYGEELSVLYDFVVTEADVRRGKVENYAMAWTPDVPRKSAGATLETEKVYSGLKVEIVETSKPANGTAYLPGETIYYKITVTNTGNVTLEPANAFDSLTDAHWLISALLPGESKSYTTQYKVKESDLGSADGRVRNTAEASGLDMTDPEDPKLVIADPSQVASRVAAATAPEPDPTPKPRRSASGVASVTQTPMAKATYSMTKTVTNLPRRGFFAPGETVIFSTTVTNTGVVTIQGLTITDSLPGAIVMSGTGYMVTGNQAFIWSLQPGESVNVIASYTVTEADAIRGSVRNVASGYGSGPDGSPARGNAAEMAVPTADLTYTVTVHYVYLADGTTAAPDQIQSGLRAGEESRFTSPSIDGYWATKARVTHTMRSHDVEITVYYVSDEVPRPNAGAAGFDGPGLVMIDEYGVPMSMGSQTMNVGDCFE